MIETRIGDVLPWQARPALYTPGEPRWYALRCAPLREEAATVWLKEEGISAFFPVKVRKVTVRGKPQERRQTFLPGYVFAKVPGDPMWHLLFDHDNPRRLIVGVLSFANGTPGRIRESDLRDLKALAARDKDAEEAEAARQAVKVGDVVRVPVLEGLADRIEVVDVIAKGGIRVRFSLFGRDNIVTVESGYEKTA